MARVLVIAEAPLGRLVSWILEDAGHWTRWIDDPAVGVTACAAIEPNVVVINGAVPAEEMPAYEASLSAAAPGVRVIDVSHQAGAPTADVPADAHLTQPFHADDLLAAVERLQHT